MVQELRGSRMQVEYFFRIHDPTTSNRQGNDVGTQYRSTIFYHNEQQKQQAEAKRNELQQTRIKNPIITDIVPAGQWFDAEGVPASIWMVVLGPSLALLYRS